MVSRKGFIGYYLKVIGYNVRVASVICVRCFHFVRYVILSVFDNVLALNYYSSKVEEPNH